MAKRKPRTMPKAGFYVRPMTVVTTIHGKVLPPNDCEIIYTTGIRGGGGHKYCRQMSSLDPDISTVPFNQWATLLWTCVPGANEMAKDYHYAATLQDALHLLKTLQYNTYP